MASVSLPSNRNGSTFRHATVSELKAAFREICKTIVVDEVLGTEALTCAITGQVLLTLPNRGLVAEMAKLVNRAKKCAFVSGTTRSRAKLMRRFAFCAAFFSRSQLSASIIVGRSRSPVTATVSQVCRSSVKLCLSHRRKDADPLVLVITRFNMQSGPLNFSVTTWLWNTIKHRYVDPLRSRSAFIPFERG